MLRGSATAGIERVQIHLEIVDDVAADHGALEEMHIVERMGEPRRVIKILRGGFAVAPVLDIDHMHRRTGCAEMHPCSRQVEIEFRVPAKQHEIPLGHCQHVFDQGTRKPDPPVITEDGPGLGHDFDARGRSLRQADGFQRIKCGFVNAKHIGVGQR
jgi:hypothetical protein